MRQLNQKVLRIHGYLLFLIGSIIFVTALSGYRSGTGRFQFLNQNSVAAVGFMEAYGLAALLGLALAISSRSRNYKPWHALAIAIHGFLFAINLCFWELYEPLGLKVAGWVATTIHAFIALLQTFFFSGALPMKETPDPFESSVAKILESRTPGYQYTIVGPDGTVLESHSGFGNLEQKTLITQDTRFGIYSVTKIFTAIAILKLCDQGLLDLNQNVEEFFPNLKFQKQIRISHLLSHTSGLVNPLPTRWVHLPEEDSVFNEPEEFFKVLSRNSSLRTEPGYNYHYSNLNYWLLAMIIEKVTSRKYAEIIVETIAKPLGIDHEISFRFNSAQTYAEGYLDGLSFENIAKRLISESKFWRGYSGKWLQINRHYVNGPGYGGAFATSRALSRLLQEFLKPKSALLSDSSRSLLFQTQQSPSGKPHPMTLGWHIGLLGNVPYYYKEGGGLGYHAEIRVYPSLKRGSVLLLNNGAFNSRKHLSKLDAEWMR